MAKQRLFMRKIKEVLRLAFEEGRSQREIARSLNIGRTSVGEYLTRARAAGRVSTSQPVLLYKIKPVVRVSASLARGHGPAAS